MISDLPQSARKCRKYNAKDSYPDITPRIDFMEPNSSQAGKYTNVYLTGINFSNFSATGYSTINFGSFKNIHISYVGSFNISFVIPQDALPGIYNIQVVNNMYPTSLYSNIVEYTLI